MCLNQRLLFPNQKHMLVTGERQAMEIGETIYAFDLFNTKANLLVGLVFIFRTLCPGDECLSAAPHSKTTGCFKIVPFLLQENIALLFLAARIASFCKPLVLADGRR